MKISPKVKRNISRILPFGFIWLIFACLFLWIEFAAVGDQENILESAIKITPNIFVFALIVITCIGFLVGYFEILFLSRLFKKKSFLVTIISKFFIYLCIFFLIILINYPIAASIELNTSLLDKRVWDRYLNFFFSITHLSAIVQLGTSLLFSLLYAEISESLGQNALLNFFTGKYHKPITETRIFMFLDMKSSTTIAEKLGHVKYFKLLKDYYFDFTEAIIKNEGEVYQYAGDEIVISWKFKKGIKENYCIKCFFDMKQDIEKRRYLYLKRYDVFPEFKAGIHFGEVTVGEIGVLKKEILFTGDVLNTAARIQGLCNTYNAEFIASKPLVESMELSEAYNLKTLKKETLKGKTKPIDLVTINNIS